MDNVPSVFYLSSARNIFLCYLINVTAQIEFFVDGYSGSFCGSNVADLDIICSNCRGIRLLECSTFASIQVTFSVSLFGLSQL